MPALAWLQCLCLVLVGANPTVGAEPAPTGGLLSPDEELARGRELFLGSRPLANGGQACSSCHGGHVTRLTAPFRDTPALAAWLANPSTPTMRLLYQTRPLLPEEIPPLVAYLQDQSRAKAWSEGLGYVPLLLLGSGAVLIALILFHWYWQRRFAALSGPAKPSEDC